jgi:hypothetical protein
MVLEDPLLTEQSSEDSEPESKRLGHTIFGFCCDSRKGTIIACIITIVLTIIYIILLITVVKNPDLAQKYLSQAAIDMIDTVIIVSALQIIISLMVICGAIIYNGAWVLFGIVYKIINAILILAVNVPLARSSSSSPLVIIVITWLTVWNFIKIYILTVFVYEIKMDVMNPETYRRERYSMFGCCNNGSSRQQQCKDSGLDLCL